MYKLKAFESDSDISIQCAVQREPQSLRLIYEIRGKTGSIDVPAPASKPVEKNQLWENTCLELFAAVLGAPEYLEFNFSPSGDWAAYKFDAYREGMRPLDLTPPPKIQCLTEPDLLTLKVEIPFELNTPCDLGITAVMKFKSGLKQYFALAHRGDRADFHRRDSFLVRL